MYPPRLAALPVLALILAACAASPPPEGEEGRRGPSAERPARGLRGELRGSDGPGGVRDDLQAQLSEVEQRLSLTPFQQVRGERYREATGALMADRPGMDPRPTVRLDAMQQIQRRVDVVRNRLVAMENIAETAGQLYESLDDPQKLIADRLLPGTAPALYSGLASQHGRRRD